MNRQHENIKESEYQECGVRDRKAWKYKFYGSEDQSQQYGNYRMVYYEASQTFKSSVQDSSVTDFTSQ